jgi:phosphogluconate dehydratase
MGYLIRELLQAGLLHPGVNTVMGRGLQHYTREPWLNQGQLEWRDAPPTTLDDSILRPVRAPFAASGGLRVLTGALGRAVIKVSAVKPGQRIVQAPALVFHSQAALLAAFERGELERDFIAVLRFQGPRANGMPELHKLTPALGVLQDRGFQVGLVTDGRMSGASGKVLAAIHVCPEAAAGGPISLLRDGDLLRLDSESGRLEVLVAPGVWENRTAGAADLHHNQQGLGRELFGLFRAHCSDAEHGACSFPLPDPESA